MAVRTALTERLGLELPIVQAPMAGVATPALAAAVSNAGGLGSLGSATLDAEALAGQIAEAGSLTQRPFNVNFFCHERPQDDQARTAAFRARLAGYYAEENLAAVPDPGESYLPFDEARLAVVLEARPAVVSFHFGLPRAEWLATIREAGCLTLATATTVEEARALEAAGIEVIVAQGWEAGGHRGTFRTPFERAQVGTLALVPQVVDAVACPVVAAGGIGDGRGIAAVLTLGAAAAQLGTSFVAAAESAAPALYRAALAGAGEADTRVTRLFTGRPARALVARYVAEMTPHETEVPDYPLPGPMVRPLTEAGLKRGVPDFHPLWSGQAARLARAEPAAAIVARLGRETEAALHRR
ncbi:nitronate monooxygenase [Tistlia consotensis]|uniref:Nitronate monooxygenase n=1 Tax=Tistlia consotensis USBA 355 TaxID=560819 RepID=A0A1Y6B8P1_9PROT|nr:nitronate monooxygenase [Tistlia consotensis]SME91297.1 nitronate monooxygenase [Tistlia consotensis USBA 355]SNR27269.1 nitronate monooxygenase [Tistlia consotensis]